MNSTVLIQELKQCKIELEEAANLLGPSLPGMASIYRIAAKRVQSRLDMYEVVSQKSD